MSTKKVTKNQAIQALGQAVMLVIKGCQSGAIKCKMMIFTIDEDAEQIEPISLESRMWEALIAAGLYKKEIPIDPLAARNQTTT